MRNLKKEMLEGIGDHFSARLHRLLFDTANTCAIAEIDGSLVAKMLMAVMLSEVIQGADALRISERDFLHSCKEGRRLWKELHEEGEPQRKTH